MREIAIRFEHDKIIFKVNGEEHFIPSGKYLALLNTEEVRNTFHELDPSVKYADLNRFEVVVLYSNLKDRGATQEQIAQALKITPKKMETWLEAIGERYIENTKKQRRDDLEAMYKKLNEYNIESVIEGI